CISKNQHKLIHKGKCYTLKRTNQNNKYWFIVVVIVATTCDRVVLDLPFLRRACRFLYCICDYKSKGFTLTLVLN
ncbi:hypothetical protein T07_8980, partial [Trichinella nelsoni]